MPAWLYAYYGLTHSSMWLHLPWQSKMETKETNPNPTPTPNQSKMETEEIPVIDYAEVLQLILSRSLSLP